MNRIPLLRYLPLLFVIAVLIIVLKPALSLPLPGVTYVDLEVVIADFGKNLSFFHPPLKYYVYHYGTQFTSILIVYKLFGFNPAPWFIIDIILRISAALIIYLFVAGWTKSKLAALVAAIFFGVNLPGLQPTTRVAFFLVYGAVISLFIFLDRWLKFHYQPTVRNLILSSLFFALAILTYPIRMIGTVPLIFLGEIYLALINYKDGTKLKLQIKHILALIIIVLLFVFVTDTLSSTPELSYKRISTNILFTSLFTGYPPTITALWLFISNLIISPISNSSIAILQPLITLILILSIFFFFNCIIRKKFLLAFTSITALTFAPFVMASSANLKDWDQSLIVITQTGGSIFILSNLFLIYMRNKNKQLSDIGMLGSMIVLSFILFPWLISPQKANNDQSAFNFIHRYYTIPSAGMGILLGSVVAASWNLIKDKLNFLQLIKYLILLPVPVCLSVLIISFTFWNMVSTNNLLVSIGRGADAAKIELFWNKIEPFLKNIKEPPAINYIYISNKSDVDNKYIQEMIADRITITHKMVYDPPKINLVNNQAELIEVLNKKGLNDSVYAFQFDGKELIDIKEGVLKIK